MFVTDDAHGVATAHWWECECRCGCQLWSISVTFRCFIRECYSSWVIQTLTIRNTFQLSYSFCMRRRIPRIGQHYIEQMLSLKQSLPRLKTGDHKESEEGMRSYESSAEAYLDGAHSTAPKAGSNHSMQHSFQTVPHSNAASTGKTLQITVLEYRLMPWLPYLNSTLIWGKKNKAKQPR